MEKPLSLVACVSDESVLRKNLLASPCLQAGTRHELLLARNCSSAAEGLNVGIERANNTWVICVHQDVFLPPGWDHRLLDQLERATRQFGPIGVEGVYGVCKPREMVLSSSGAHVERHRPESPPRFAVNRAGRVFSHGQRLFDGRDVPAKVSTLDELLLVVPRDTPLRFDATLGFHFYGADICLQAEARGLPVVVLDAVCHHNTQTVVLPKPFFRSAQVFAEKWSHRLPVATPCVVIDTQNACGSSEAQRGLRPLLTRSVKCHAKSSSRKTNELARAAGLKRNTKRRSRKGAEAQRREDANGHTS